MKRILLDDDIHPLSEFRSKASGFLAQIHNTKRPIVITQNGKSAAILLDVSEYEAMVEKIEVLEDIKIANEQIRSGLGISHDNVKKRFAKRVNK